MFIWNAAQESNGLGLSFDTFDVKFEVQNIYLVQIKTVKKLTKNTKNIKNN